MIPDDADLTQYTIPDGSYTLEVLQKERKQQRQSAILNPRIRLSVVTPKDIDCEITVLLNWFRRDLLASVEKLTWKSFQKAGDTLTHAALFPREVTQARVLDWVKHRMEESRETLGGTFLQEILRVTMACHTRFERVSPDDPPEWDIEAWDTRLKSTVRISCKSADNWGNASSGRDTQRVLANQKDAYTLTLHLVGNSAPKLTDATNCLSGADAWYFASGHPAFFLDLFKELNYTAEDFHPRLQEAVDAAARRILRRYNSWYDPRTILSESRHCSAYRNLVGPH